MAGSAGRNAASEELVDDRNGPFMSIPAARNPIKCRTAEGGSEPKLTHTVMDMDRSNSPEAFSFGSATNPDHTTPCFPSALSH